MKSIGPFLAFAVAIFCLTSCNESCKSERGFPTVDEMKELRGKKVEDVVKLCGNPDEMLSGELFGTKFQEGRISVVFVYHFEKENVVYFREDGYVLGAGLSKKARMGMPSTNSSKED